MEMIPDLQKRSREQAIVDAEEEIRLEQEREAARIAEARRHPDELSQDERLARVRGIGERAVEQLKAAGYPTVEAIHNEADVMRLAENTALGIKKARQIKHAVGVYLEEEAKLRTELNAERASGAKQSGGSPL
jgi:N utilization substance protein A